jgi:hypothetical protein
MAKKTGPKRKEPPRSVVLTIKGTDAWRAWLEKLADHSRMPASTVVDLALIDFAKKIGFEEEAPKR